MFFMFSKFFLVQQGAVNKKRLKTAEIGGKRAKGW
jgi:hypothetical protein